MRVALIHDYLIEYGGAERVLEALGELWPDAPVYTSIYATAGMSPTIRARDIRPSPLQRLPRAARLAKLLVPLYAPAFAGFDLRDYDAVVSVSSFMAKNVDGRFHLDYCLTPPRFLWGYPTYLDRRTMPAPVRALLPLVNAIVRRQDLAAAEKVDRFVAISDEVRRRVATAYGREAAVIYPPVELDRFTRPPRSPGDYYLLVARLGDYKRADLAVQACSRLGRRLVVVGSGASLPALRALAGPTVEFAGRVSDAELADLYAGCEALIFPGVEDFGLVLVEVQAAGRPVVAFAGGGALETVVPGATGTLFDAPTADGLTATLEAFDPRAFDPEACRRNAARFGKPRFLVEFRAAVEGSAAGRPPDRRGALGWPDDLGRTVRGG